MLLGLVLTACSQPELEEEEPQFLDVNLTIMPEKAEVNEEVTFEAKVTYGEEKVNDADEVKFEIWRANEENHETTVVEKGVNGIYKLNKTFNEEGTYYVISHVTARSMHNMPKKEFIIGKPSEPESDPNSSENMEQDAEEEHNDH